MSPKRTCKKLEAENARLETELMQLRVVYDNVWTLCTDTRFKLAEARYWARYWKNYAVKSDIQKWACHVTKKEE